MSYYIINITYQDYGYPQVTSTEVLKSYVHNSPVETVTGPTESTVSKVLLCVCVCTRMYYDCIYVVCMHVMCLCMCSVYESVCVYVCVSVCMCVCLCVVYVQSMK